MLFCYRKIHVSTFFFIFNRNIINTFIGIRRHGKGEMLCVATTFVPVLLLQLPHEEYLLPQVDQLGLGGLPGALLLLQAVDLERETTVYVCEFMFAKIFLLQKVAI